MLNIIKHSMNKSQHLHSYFRLTMAMLLVAVMFTGCASQKEASEQGRSLVQLEKTTEDQNWKVVVHWAKNRDSLPGFSETYRPAVGNTLLMVYLTFERNPAFSEKDDVLKLDYTLANNRQTISMSGAGNNEVFLNERISLLVTPDLKDPNDRPYSAQIFFEVPAEAQDFRLLVGSAPPLELKK